MRRYSLLSVLGGLIGSLPPQKPADPTVRVTNTEDQQEKSEAVPIPLEKWRFEYAVKTWGLQVKSASYDAAQRKYTFVVEFTRDLKPEELKSLIEAFPPTSRGGGSKNLAFYFFDKDNPKRSADICPPTAPCGRRS